MAKSDIEALRRSLKSRNKQTRLAAVAALAEMRNNASIFPLCEAYSPRDAKMREAITKALVQKGTSATKPILDAVTNLVGSEFSADAHDILTDIGDIPALREALYQENAAMKATAAQALGYLHDTASLPVLCAMLKDKNLELRIAGAYAVRFFQEEIAVQSLCEALAKINQKQEGEPDDNHTFGEVIVHSVIEIGQVAIPYLLPLLQKRDWVVRYYAIQCLAGIDDPRGVLPLCRALLDTQETLADAAFDALTNPIDPYVLLDRLILEQQMTPEERFKALMVVQRNYKRGEFIWTLNRFPNIRDYCLNIRESKDERLRNGANEIIAYLREQELLRASSAPEQNPDELLRPATDDLEMDVDDLLRGSEAPPSEPKAGKSWWQRLFKQG